jgi:hypothetical protein
MEHERRKHWVTLERLALADVVDGEDVDVCVRGDAADVLEKDAEQYRVAGVLR